MDVPAALVYMQRGIIAYVQNQDTRSAQEDFERVRPGGIGSHGGHTKSETGIW